MIIEDATSNDTGDYTCKFKHNENGVYYNVSATRAFKFEGKLLGLIGFNRKNI